MSKKRPARQTIRFSDSKKQPPSRAAWQANAAPSPDTTDSQLRKDLDLERERLTKAGGSEPTVDAIRQAADAFFWSEYLGKCDDTGIGARKAARRLYNESIRVLMSWMRHAWPENPAIDSAFQSVVHAVRNGDLTAAEQIVERIQSADESAGFNVTLKMLRLHAGCKTRTPFRTAIKGENPDHEKRGNPYWYRYAQLLPILKAKTSTAKFNWPSSVAGLKKPTKTSE